MLHDFECKDHKFSNVKEFAAKKDILFIYVIYSNTKNTTDHQ